MPAATAEPDVAGSIIDCDVDRTHASELAVRLVVLEADQIACAGWRVTLASEDWVSMCVGTTSVAVFLKEIEAMHADVAVVGLSLGNEEHGADVCRLLTQKHPDVRVIIACDTDLLPVTAARAAGASGLVHRAWPVERLLSAVREVARGGLALAGTPVRAAAGSRLSRRELTVLRLLATGASNTEIAGMLNLSRHTVKEYTQTLFRKLGVRNRVEAATAAARLGYAR
jgi:DNA-binding NarL/FixJ family response regulator